MNQESRIKSTIGNKTGEAMWEEIDDLVVRWSQRDPVGANAIMEHNQKLRDGLFDAEFGQMSQEAMANGRLQISVHPDLVAYIETFFPAFFESKKNVRRFGNTYKMFKIADKL
jgi:hypothetical protein